MRKIKADRSLLLYILFGFLTCGIYSLVFMYCMISDINEMLHGDGKHTHNIFFVWLLSILTCGIYTFIWYYQLGDRLGDGLRVRQIHSDVSGSSVLLWQIVGIFLCAVGSFIALYQIINATNQLAMHHNQDAPQPLPSQGGSDQYW